MPKYKRRSVTVEAFQWTRYDAKLCPKWFTDAQLKPKDQPGACLVINDCIVKVFTPTGIMTAYKDDFIIRTEKGDLYPCTPGVFNFLHDEITD